MFGEVSLAPRSTGHLLLAPCLAGLCHDNNCSMAMLRTMRRHNLAAHRHRRIRVSTETTTACTTACLKRVLSRKAARCNNPHSDCTSFLISFTCATHAFASTAASARSISGAARRRRPFAIAVPSSRSGTS